MASLYHTWDENYDCGKVNGIFVSHWATNTDRKLTMYIQVGSEEWTQQQEQSIHE